ncbi:cytochrome P450 [Saccharopolyspora cebuensis]|uniref:Cytochrome P450 n=2 Tax=Saccharopolyspora cebuensis TaxID=418759 RepID=A0ABV4CSG0_9PSEU
MSVPELDLTDPDVARDPVAAYQRLRERGPVARLAAPGLPAPWALTRYRECRAMLGDPRFELSPASFAMRPTDLPEELLPYLRTMQETEGAEHLRLRRLAAPAFTARRATGLRPRVQRIVDRLLDALPEHAEDGAVDLSAHFTRPLPMEVICELVGIPEADRPRWREYGAAVATGSGPALVAAIPGVIADARAAVAHRTAEPGEDLLSELVRIRDEDGDRLGEVELVALVWQLVLAGQTPANLIANAVGTLFEHPDALAALRTGPELLPRAVEESLRWCGPQLLAIPRFAREDVEVAGAELRAGEMVVAVLSSANRDPRAFADPERFDIAREPTPGHLGFAHGPHFCLGASLARVQTEVALGSLLRRYPALAPVRVPERQPDPGTWRLPELTATL